MIFSKSAAGIAATAVVLLMTAACGSDSSSPAATTASTTQTNGMRSSIAATASSVVSSARSSAQQTIQDAINTVLAAAPITFTSGSSDLSAVDIATIKAVALPLEGNDTKIQITTYAQDSNPITAKSLANARADNIVTALEAEGIDKTRITVQADANPTESDVQVDEAEIAVVGD